MDESKPDQEAQLRTVLERHVHEDLAAWTMAHARWAQRLTRRSLAGPVRVGGDPVLPPGSPWPYWRGRPLSLLAVIDVAALQRRPEDLHLPSVEHVNLFYDLDDHLGEGFEFVPGHRIVAAGADAVLTAPPDRSIPRLEPVTYEVRPVLTIPGYDEPVITRHCGLTEADHPWTDDRVRNIADACFEWEAVCDVADSCDEGQIGGWPDLYQNPIFDDCDAFTHAAETGVRVVVPGAPPRWRQLAQFGWNTVLDPLFGDTRVHFCFDAAADDPLTRTAAQWQGT